MWKIITRSEKETFNLGRRLGEFLAPGDVVLLWGQLGAGKTVLVKGVSSSKGINHRDVDSASFVLLKIYGKKEKVFHYDFFRLHSSGEIVDSGFFEYLEEGISLVEWPQYVRDVLNGIPFLEVFIEHLDLNVRRVKFTSSDKRFKIIIKKIKYGYGSK